MADGIPLDRKHVRQITDLLVRPEAYPWNPATVEFIETHISWLFLAGEYVVKVKRPVTFDFVDYSTIERRHHSCLEEVRLNRRLTEDVYLGVVPIVEHDHELLIGGEGEPVEWATLMRRLPANRMLDRLIAMNDLPADLATRLARHLAPFHRTTADFCRGTTEEIRASLIEVVLSNLNELQVFAGKTVSPVQLRLIDGVLREFVIQHGALFTSRVSEGFVRDGHGDLRCEHICLDGERLQIYDCVEFSPSIRCSDIASDLAFLLMDLERLGQRLIAQELVQIYANEGIVLPPALLAFYRAHRALVRAKISSLSGAGDVQCYLNLAMRSATHIDPVLIIMTGLSGTGKSTCARIISDLTGAPVFASDTVRKELAGVVGSAASEWQTGIYNSDWNARTYQRLFELAHQTIDQNLPVVLDASFLANEQREHAASVARTRGVPMLIVETQCDEDIVLSRLEKRQREQASPSDAGRDIFARQRTALIAGEPAIPEGATHVVVDTGEDVHHWVDRIVERLSLEGIIVPGITDHRTAGRVVPE